MQPGDWQDIETLEGPALVERLLHNVEAVLDADPEREDDALRALPGPMQIVWLLHQLDFEAIQGSLSAYFLNSAGRHAAGAVESLRRIGAEEMATVVEQARELVAGHAEAWAARRDELDAEGEFAVVQPYDDLAGEDELDALTDLYFLAAEREDWGGKLERHVTAERATVVRWAAA